MGSIHTKRIVDLFIVTSVYLLLMKMKGFHWEPQFLYLIKVNLRVNITPDDGASST